MSKIKAGDIVQIFGRAKYAPPHVRNSHKMLGTIIEINDRDEDGPRSAKYLVLLEDNDVFSFFDDEFTILFTGDYTQNDERK